jgi:hypothetical protein
MKCELCGFVDHSVTCFISPARGNKKIIGYKCKKYGCIVSVNSTCKGEINAEKQEQEKTSQ